MTIKLYGLEQSRSFRCLWALCETKAAFDYIPVTFSEGTNSVNNDDYLAKNNQGKVPTLEHDDFVLTESAAIVNYIDTLSEQSFIPTAPMARAKFDELSYFILCELEQPLWTAGKHRFALPEEQRVADIFSTAAFEFDKALRTLAKLTQVTPYALGDEFTFADILLAQTINWAERFEFEVTKQYLDYRDKQYEREAAKRALEIIS